MNRAEFLLLSVLDSSGASSRLTAMTLQEIVQAEDIGYKENSVYKLARKYEREGFLGRGMKDGRAQSWYITQQGISLLTGERSGTVPDARG